MCAAAATAAIAGAPAPAAHAVPGIVEIVRPAAGPLGPITVIGDSVLVGASIEPSLPTHLAARGWGPIRFRAGLGYTAGNFQPAGSDFAAANWIQRWRSQGWDAPNVVVNLGNNDVGFCRTDLACNANTIRYLLDAIGPGRTVWWSKITRIYTLGAEAAAYNAALDLVAAERSNLRVWDWPAAQAGAGIRLSGDGIHLADPVAYRQRSLVMADDITARLAVATRTGADAALPTATGAPSEYVALTPRRLVDTRQEGGVRLAAGETRVVDLSAYVPGGTTAVAANLTAADPAATGYLSAFPCDRTAGSEVSSVNYTAGATRGALAVLPVTAAGSLCVFSAAATDLLVDLQGAFVAEGDRFTPVAPDRLLDTRASGRAAVHAVAVPAGAAAVAVNLTATRPAGPGFLTAYPCGTAPPEVSSVNFGPGETVAGSAIVPVGAGGAICVFTDADVDVVVDITGTFAATGALRFVPAEPARTYDTRLGIGGWTPIHGANQVTDVRVVPPGAAAVTGTITLVQPTATAYVTAYGCGAVPPTSSVNAARGAVLANSVSVGVEPNGRLCVLASAPAHVLFDTTGWWQP
jgi:hypothetical protein